MPINYLCIDDEPEVEILPLLKSLELATRGLKFSFINPDDFENTAQLIGSKRPDGLLLDLRLDDKANCSGKKARYKAMSLAQHLRTKMTEDKSLSFPIVLWSIDGNFKKSYNRDKTAHDIFDAVYHKGNVSKDCEQLANELVDLVKGYEFIGERLSRGKVLYKILGLSSDDEMKSLDPRMGGKFARMHAFPIHVYAQFLLKTFLRYPGPVINELHLASRLGINVALSNDWVTLLDKKLKGAEYKGAFCKSHPRWWMHEVDKWWNKISEGNFPLRSLSASERVDLIKKKTKLIDIVAAEPIADGYSDKFWTVCEVLKVPLSPNDGIKIVSCDEDWQESEYVSLKGRLERIDFESYEINPLEIQRLKRLIGIVNNADR